MNKSQSAAGLPIVFLSCLTAKMQGEARARIVESVI